MCVGGVGKRKDIVRGWLLLWSLLLDCHAEYHVVKSRDIGMWCGVYELVSWSYGKSPCSLEGK